MLNRLYAVMSRNSHSIAEDWICFAALMTIMVVSLNLPSVL